MATVNKDFKIKNGLVVEGSTATVNGYDILTKKTADQNYIIGLIGGSATPDATPDTVVLRDENADFSANMITSDLTGDVTGTVSDISNHSTTDLSEGTNLYYTDSRVKDVLTGATKTNIVIETIDGDLHITAENGVEDSTTDDLDEGTTNKYFTDARARQAISEGTGINYDNSTGVVSADLGDFDTDDLSEGSTNKYFTTTRVDNHLTGGDGITYSAGTISADVAGGLHIDNAQVKIDRTTVDTWYDAAGAAGDVASDLSTHEGLTEAHGATGAVVGTTNTQQLSNKTFVDTVYFTDGVTVNNEGEIAIRAVSHDFDVQANYGDLNLKTVASGYDVNITSTLGSIILNADEAAYYGSASAENEIATHGYVDNAVSGLTWKQAVNLFYNDSTPTLSGDSVTTPLVIDGHPALGAGEVGYRILVAYGDDAGLYVYNQTGTSWTLDRATDGDTYEELIGAAVYVMEGTQYGSTSWVQGNHYLSAFTGQSWTQFSGQGSVTAGTGITVDGLEVSIDRTTVDTWYDYSGAASDAIDAHDVGTGVHGLSGSVVGTSDSQTLTNKTIDASSNTLSNIANSSLTNSSIDVNGYTTSLGSSVTLDTDDISEGTNQYFTQTRARQSLSSGTAINYDDTTGVISVDATELDTDDIGEGATNKYYTDSRVKSVLTASTQTNISITEVAGELIITAENGVDDSTTDDLEEGTNNHYFTDNRAKDAAGYLLENSTQSNISITYDEGTRQLTVTAEDGFAGHDTDDLGEGTSNLYFTNTRAVDAIDGADITPQTVTIDTYRKEEATQTYFATASTATVHSFAAPYGSVKYLVRVVGTVSGTLHSQIVEILATVDGNNNVAITEFGSIHTTEPALASFTVEYDGVSGFNLRATTTGAMEVVVAATLLSWAD
jgi:hypothetical protein